MGNYRRLPGGHGIRGFERDLGPAISEKRAEMLILSPFLFVHLN
jgi:hypothetical protein